MNKLENEKCPVCMKSTLTLIEDEKEVPYFGKIFIFSMNCSNCNYNMADVEAEQPRPPVKITFTIEAEKDLSARVIKSSVATIKIPQLRMESSPGAVADGYVSNVEGLLARFEEVLKDQQENAEDDADKKTAKNLLKKIRKVKFGDIPLKIIIEDPTGNSMIIDKKAIVESFKAKKK